MTEHAANSATGSGKTSVNSAAAGCGAHRLYPQLCTGLCSAVTSAAPVRGGNAWNSRSTRQQDTPEGRVTGTVQGEREGAGRQQGDTAAARTHHHPRQQTSKVLIVATSDPRPQPLLLRHRVHRFLLFLGAVNRRVPL